MHGTNNMLLMVLDVQCTLTQPGCMKNAVSLPRLGKADPLGGRVWRSGVGGIHQWDWTKKLTPTVYTDTPLYCEGVFLCSLDLLYSTLLVCEIAVPN